MSSSATAKSRAANVSALIRRNGLTPQPSESATVHTGTIVRAGLEWPTVSISDPWDRPSNMASGEREVKDRTAHVVEVLTKAGYLVDWTVKDLGGIHGWFGHITVTGRRPKLTKTDQAALIAKQALEICRGARKSGYVNTIGSRELAETAQALMMDPDAWTMRYAAKIVLADLADEEEEDLIGEGLRELTARK